MAKRYPRASWQPLGRQTESPMRSHDIICIHTMVGSLPGTDSMFDRDGYGGTESHFGTGGDGTCIQWQDLAYSADANLDGWHRVISIENADMGAPFPSWGGSNVPRFSTPQADRLVDLIAWLCSREAHADCPSSWTCHQVGIPARMVPDSRPGRRGIATHRQGCDGNFPDNGPLAGRVAGGERWSTSRGKVCPGDRRILELVDEILPRVQAHPTVTNREEDDMTYTDWPKKDQDQLVDDVADAVVTKLLAAKVRNVNPGGGQHPAPVGNMLTNIEAAGDHLLSRVADLDAKLDQLLAAGGEATPPKA